MNDIAFVAIILAFFLAAALFVTACDRIIGTDEDTLASSPGVEPGPAPERVAA